MIDDLLRRRALDLREKITFEFQKRSAEQRELYLTLVLAVGAAGGRVVVTREEMARLDVGRVMMISEWDDAGNLVLRITP